METILVVDNETHIRDILRYPLTQSGFNVVEASDGNEAIEQFTAVGPDLLILDIMMPEMDGTDVCRKIRQKSDVPIIFLSAKSQDIDKIIGLEIGGDDYVTKPFEPQVVVSLVKAMFRRIRMIHSRMNSSEPKEKNELIHNRLRLDLDSLDAYWNQDKVILAATGFNILKTLMSHPNKVYSRSELMDSAYSDHRIVSDRTIDSHLRTIRKKFQDAGAENPIESRHGFGYIMAACD